MAEPFHRRIRSDILARVASGEWPPGHRLPSTPRLVEFYRVELAAPDLAASTVRHAISLLIESGTLRGQQGVGVFVAEPGATPGSGV